MTKHAKITFASCCHSFVESSITRCIELNCWSQTTEAGSDLNRVSVLIMDVASTGDRQTNNKSIQTCKQTTLHVHTLKHAVQHWMILHLITMLLGSLDQFPGQI